MTSVKPQEKVDVFYVSSKTFTTMVKNDLVDYIKFRGVIRPSFRGYIILKDETKPNYTYVADIIASFLSSSSRLSEEGHYFKSELPPIESELDCDVFDKKVIRQNLVRLSETDPVVAIFLGKTVLGLKG